MQPDAHNDPDAPAGQPMAAITGEPESPGQHVVDPMSLEPTQAEIDDWAERERRRRAAWLQGPTEDERADYARRMRERRLADLEGGSDPWAEWSRQMKRYPREMQLAMEGAMSLALRWSRRSYEELQRAGRDWESEYGNPVRRRRVPLDDDRP